MIRIKKKAALLAAALLILINCLPASAEGVIKIPPQMTEIGAGAFKNNTAITTLILPDAGITVGEGAFDGCENLRMLHILSDSLDSGIPEELKKLSSLLYVTAPAGSRALLDAASCTFDYRAAGQKARALIMYETYGGVLQQLFGTKTDADAMETVLEAWGFEVRKVTGLTKGKMQEEIGNLAEGSELWDITMIYYSGHGDRTGSLIGRDNSKLSADELATAVGGISGRKIVIADACYSGLLIDDGVGTLTVENRMMESGEADQQKSFSFTATIKENEYYVENGSITGMGMRIKKSVNKTYGDLAFVEGVSRFTLTGNETKQAVDLPGGYYEIIMTPDEDYTTVPEGTSGWIGAEDAVAVFKQKRKIGEENPEEIVSKTTKTAESTENPDLFSSEFVSAFQGGTDRSGMLRAPSMLARLNKTYVIAASGYDEQSMEMNMGFFTKHFCMGLGWDGENKIAVAKAADTDGDGFITFAEAYTYAKNSLMNDQTLNRYGITQSVQANNLAEQAGSEHFAPFWPPLE